MVLLLHFTPPLAGGRDMVGYSDTEKVLQRTLDCDGALYEAIMGHGNDAWHSALHSWGWRT